MPFSLPIFSQKFLSGKKKQHKHNLFGPDFPRTFLTLTPGCPGVRKFLPTTGAAGKRTFWCGRPRFSSRTSMTRRVVEKLCTKKVCVDFLAPILRSGSSQRGRCRRGRSEIPHFSSKLQLFAPCSRIKRKKAKKSAKKGEIPAKKGEIPAKKAKKKGRLPPAPSTPTRLRTSQ